MRKDLIDKYHITYTDAVIAHLYAFFYRKNRFYIAFQYLFLKYFRYLANKYHEASNLEGYFCECFYGFPVGKYSYGVMQFCQDWINIKSIGAFCSIAPNVTITGQNHPLTYISTHPFIYAKDRGFLQEDNVPLMDTDKNVGVTIGNDVWIGQNVTILPCVHIGNGAVVGAGSIVTKHVPDYAVVAGNPAKILKYRFTDEEINRLNEIEWWEWPDDMIKKNIKTFTENDGFFNAFDGSRIDMNGDKVQ